MLERLTWLEDTCPDLSAEDRQPILLAAADDPAHEIRRFAAGGLPSTRPLSPARRALGLLARDGDKQTRLMAVIGSLEIYSVEGDAPDEGDDLPPIKWLVAGAAKAMRAPTLAHAATRALGLCGHPAAKAPLQAQIRRWLGDPYVRLEAWASLARLGQRDHLPDIRKALRKPVLRPMAAALLGELKATEARPDLEAFLANPKARHAYAAADALGALGDPAARPALKRAAAEHPDPETRRAAEAALSQLPSPP